MERWIPFLRCRRSAGPATGQINTFDTLHFGGQFLRDSFVQEQRNRMNTRVFCKAPHQYVITQAVANRAHDHALMVGHIGIDRLNLVAGFQSFRRIVDGFQHAVKTGKAELDQ